MGEKRRRFTEEFKREAVRLAFDGGQPTLNTGDVRTWQDLDLGIDVHLLR
jgi:transposase-like protein